MILLIDNRPAVIKDGSSFEYHSDNRLFMDRDDYSLSIELPLGCPENDAIFGNINRKDVDINNIYFAAEIICDNFHKRGAAVITAITDDVVKVQFLEKRSYQNFYPDFDNRYIDELELGSMPYWKPNNYAEASGGMSGRPRPGYATGDETTVEYKSPAQAWGDGDIIALPWVNNTSGNIQNRADYVNGAYKWHVAQDDDDDTELVSGLSCQIRLYKLVELICDALGYDFEADDWRNSEYYHLYSFNTAPFAWGLGTWQSTLPHWSLNEFFENIEKLLLCEFDIDHEAQCITFSWSNENVVAAGVVALTEIIDEFTATVTRDDESKYKGVRNIGYADAGHEMWNFYSCYWFFHKGARYAYSYDTLQELITALRNISSSTGHRGSPSAQSLYYAADVDTYFVLYGIKREKTGGTSPIYGDLYETVYRLLPLNIFGDRINDEENWEDKEEIGIVPVWIDDTLTAEEDSYKGETVFMDMGTTDNTSTSGESYTYGRRPNATTVPYSTLLQSSLIENIKAGDNDGDNGISYLQVGFWFGNYQQFAPYLPHPFIDSFDLKVTWQVTNQHVVHTWTRIDSGHDVSLRLNNDSYGQGQLLAAAIEIEPHRKYEFSFLSDTMPDVRSVFIIRGKKYLCAQIKTDINQNGMSQLKKGTFYRISE
ncbi:MAG: hypothetical protein J5565_06325 [Muribaculaceae bacterium]|nr:hypothetical protein [Muribaculaceae bacterium]